MSHHGDLPWHSLDKGVHLSLVEREIGFNLFLLIFLVVECPTQIIGLTSLL
jgi:hypothetical protein